MKVWQDLAGAWSNLVFAGHLDRVTPKIRALRLLEEVLELCQAEAVTAEEAAIVARQVFSRPTGEAEQELGGVMTTLMAYAYTAERDCEAAWWREFRRIMDPAIMDKVRRRNLEGDKIGLNPTTADIRRIPAHELTNEQLIGEQDRCERIWHELHEAIEDGEELGGGSPLEGISERAEEVALELKKRASAKVRT
ncbi:MAG TPA: hypothetical protein VD970_01985 [Acetobacteraceae bacterium]|nr:hypothetical protein [Acetobacteraceae bacterium]